VQPDQRLLSVVRRAVNLLLRVEKNLELRSAKRRAQSSIDTDGTIGKLTLLTLLPKDAVILEIGACEGHDTQEFAVLFPRGRVIAFEAHPQLHQRLVERTRGLPNVDCVGLAMSDHAGVQVFHQSSGASRVSGSLLRPSEHLQRHPAVVFSSADEVLIPCATLDQYVGQMAPERVDLIWMDVQGAELMALKGAERTLSLTTWIYLEVSRAPLYEGAAPYSEIKQFLSSLGFEVEREFLPPEWHGEGNVLFARSLKSSLG